MSSSKPKNLDKYYKSRVHSGSIIIIRPLIQGEHIADNLGFDYKFLIMKRSPNIIFGGFYAFSGGKVED